MRYINIFTSLYNLAIKRYLENRVNTFGSIFFSTLSFVTTIIFIEIMFNFMGEFNGWDKNRVLMLAGLTKVVITIFYSLVQRGIANFSYFIRNGELDVLLTKPISAQFLLSFRYIRSFELLNVLPGMILFVYAFNKMGLSWDLWQLILLIINLICGFIVLYGIFFSLACLAFWIEKFDSLGVIYYMMTTPLSYPTSIYGRTISFFLTFILPLGFIAMIPLQIFLDKIYYLVLLAIIFASLFLSFSIWLWNFALRRYTSASS